MEFFTLVDSYAANHNLTLLWDEPCSLLACFQYPNGRIERISFADALASLAA